MSKPQMQKTGFAYSTAVVDSQSLISCLSWQSPKTLEIYLPKQLKWLQEGKCHLLLA